MSLLKRAQEKNEREAADKLARGKSFREKRLAEGQKVKDVLEPHMSYVQDVLAELDPEAPVFDILHILTRTDAYMYGVRGSSGDAKEAGFDAYYDIFAYKVKTKYGEVVITALENKQVLVGIMKKVQRKSSSAKDTPIDVNGAYWFPIDPIDEFESALVDVVAKQISK